MLNFPTATTVKVLLIKLMQVPGNVLFTFL